jgi:hypothetical protein
VGGKGAGVSSGPSLQVASVQKGQLSRPSDAPILPRPTIVLVVTMKRRTLGVRLGSAWLAKKRHLDSATQAATKKGKYEPKFGEGAVDYSWKPGDIAR